MSESVITCNGEMSFQEMCIAETSGAVVAEKAGFWEYNLISNGACHFFKGVWWEWTREGNKAWLLILDLRTFLEPP